MRMVGSLAMAFTFVMRSGSNVHVQELQSVPHTSAQPMPHFPICTVKADIGNIPPMELEMPDWCSNKFFSTRRQICSQTSSRWIDIHWALLTKSLMMMGQIAGKKALLPACQGSQYLVQLLSALLEPGWSCTGDHPWPDMACFRSSTRKSIRVLWLFSSLCGWSTRRSH